MGKSGPVRRRSPYGIQITRQIAVMMNGINPGQREHVAGENGLFQTVMAIDFLKIGVSATLEESGNIAV